MPNKKYSLQRGGGSYRDKLSRMDFLKNHQGKVDSYDKLNELKIISQGSPSNKSNKSSKEGHPAYRVSIFFA